MKQDIAEIAGKLTKAQREAMLMATERWPSGLFRVCGTGMTRKALRDRGLGHGDWCYLTPTGLAVRAHLLAHSHPEKQA